MIKKTHFWIYIRIIIWPWFVAVYKFDHHITSTSLVARLSPNPICNGDLKGGPLRFLQVCAPVALQLLLQFRLMQRDNLGDEHRLSHFPRKEVLDAGSQLSAPSRNVVVDSGGRVYRTLLGWHSGNMHMVEVYGTLV